MTPVLLLTVEGLCLQLQTASQSVYHIQILMVFVNFCKRVEHWCARWVRCLTKPQVGRVINIVVLVELLS